MSKQITYINKPNQGGHQHITHCGGNGWETSVADIVYNIRNKIESYYVQDSSGRSLSNVGVVEASNHAPYLRTYANGQWNDNLLSLPNRTVGWGRSL